MNKAYLELDSITSRELRLMSICNPSLSARWLLSELGNQAH